VDPTKEVAAYKEAIKAGLTTVTDVIAATAGGLDIEDVLATRKRELELMEQAGVQVDTTLSAPSLPAGEPPPDPPPEGDDDNQSDDPPRRVISFPR
jgi:capsid protein